MKAKRWISLLLAVSMMLGVLAMPASAAAQQPESTAVVSEELPDAAALSAAEDENDIVNIRIRATGNLVYGSDYKLEVETRPENTQYIAVVLGTSGDPSTWFSGIRFTWQLKPRSSPISWRAQAAVSFTSRIMAYSKEIRRPVASK